MNTSMLKAHIKKQLVQKKTFERQAPHLANGIDIVFSKDEINYRVNVSDGVFACITLDVESFDVDRQCLNAVISNFINVVAVRFIVIGKQINDFFQ